MWVWKLWFARSFSSSFHSQMVAVRRKCRILSTGLAMNRRFINVNIFDNSLSNHNFFYWDTSPNEPDKIYLDCWITMNTVYISLIYYLYFVLRSTSRVLEHYGKLTVVYVIQVQELDEEGCGLHELTIRCFCLCWHCRRHEFRMSSAQMKIA